MCKRVVVMRAIFSEVGLRELKMSNCYSDFQGHSRSMVFDFLLALYFSYLLTMSILFCFRYIRPYHIVSKIWREHVTQNTPYLRVIYHAYDTRSQRSICTPNLNSVALCVAKRSWGRKIKWSHDLITPIWVYILSSEGFWHLIWPIAYFRIAFEDSSFSISRDMKTHNVK